VVRELQASDPAMVGPYRLLGRLGAGGMGRVYLAKSPGGRAVAVKVIRPQLAEEYGFRARFAQEVAAAREVSGFFTAPVIDADPNAEVPWMATAYVPGPSLAAAVEEQGPLSVETVLALGAGLAEGLQAIHAAGLVHRDLKPSNVLLAADGPRVIDFGISRAVEQTMMTTIGAVLGSPGFMSPEQALGSGEIGSPTDVFSLGAVLAFASSGSHPFGVGPVPTLMYRVVYEAPDLARTPPALRPLLEACMAKDPAARPTTDDLLRRLSHSVDLLTPDWLPASVADTLVRYVPTAPARTAQPVPPQEPRVADAARIDDDLPTVKAATAHAAPPAQVAAGVAEGARPRHLWPVMAAVGTAAAVLAVVAVLVLSSPGQAKPGPGHSLSPTPSLTHTAASPRPTQSARPKATATRPKPTATPATTTQPTSSYSPAPANSGSSGDENGPGTSPTSTCTSGFGNGNGGGGFFGCFLS
jgi:eukaryotic-like serine/threonine-protein kinase